MKSIAVQERNKGKTERERDLMEEKSVHIDN